MKREHIDWSILKGTLWALITCTIISGAFILASWWVKSTMQEQYTNHKKSFQSASRKYLEVDNELDLITEYYPEILGYFERGILGKEQRLNWIEVLQNAGENIKLIHLRYEIKAQDEHKPRYKVDTRKFRLYSSDMQLNAELLHEGDLINLLNELNHRALGLYSVSSCKFSRLQNIITDEITRGNIQADCLLDWFNIRESDGDEITL